MAERSKFDEIIDRTKTRSTKWTRYQALCGEGKQYPLWIADMDFAVCGAIRKALLKRAAHPVYGYTDRAEADFALFAERFEKIHHYGTKTQDVILSTGVMYSLAAAIELFTEPGDAILIPTPAYPPFFDAVQKSARRLVKVPMKVRENRWELDLERMEEAAGRGASAVILCNPHNPTGRVFTGKELREFAGMCERKGLQIFSDEIHCDLVYGEPPFEPVMNVSDYAAQNTAAMVAPTKSFNLAGLKISAAVIKNREKNERFRAYASRTGIASINLFALEAVHAAYGESEGWLRDLVGYLDENRSFTEDFLAARLPFIRTANPEGTYFHWLDFREGPLDPGRVHETLLNQGKVILNEGKTFGEEYTGFERLNFACPRPFLEEALEQMARVLKGGK